MAIYIYNSLTRKKEEFVSLSPAQIKMYVCGPTVYDQPHIGHARSAYIFDFIRHYFEYRGYKVKFVRNVTDVDDKIIDRARKDYQGEDLNTSFKKIADKYLAEYHDALNKLEINPSGFAIIEPKASEYIGKMIRFIDDLINRGAAYSSGSDVYFDITKALNYGKLSHQSLDKMEIGSRVSSGENKKNPLDFALWKSAKVGEPSWESPWGKGRPGWHIECSVMSSDILGDEFDIHGGGLDLIFPHHENEIAQSEGAGKKFARFWIHHGLLTINGQKMSKSLGNFITINDFLDKHSQADFLKLFFLSAHYSHPIDYNEEKIAEAKKALERVLILLKKIEEKISAVCQQSAKKYNEIEEIKNKFILSMDDDFNTPKALAAIFDLVNLANKNIDDLGFAYKAKEILKELLGLLGLSLEFRNQADDAATVASSAFIMTEEWINKKIEERVSLKKEKKYSEADKIRKELEEKGIILEDTRDGKTSWRRKL